MATMNADNRGSAMTGDPRSEPAATPGPWRQSHRKCTDGMYRTQIYCGKGEPIATLHWYPVDLGKGTIGTSREANARLIAAAPDMLDALRACVEMYGDHDDPDDDWTAMQKARAAIAKATGGAP